MRKIGLLLLVIFAILASVVIGSFLYTTRYEVTTIDTLQSPDGAYKIELQSIGEPYWPFGAAPGRLVLSTAGAVVSQTKIQIANDGSKFTKSAWSVTWFDGYVEIILSGEEQYDELVILYFDGQTESKRLETQLEKNTEIYSGDDNSESMNDIQDNAEQELYSGQWKIEDGYLAIYELVSNKASNDFEIYYGASESSTKCTLFEDGSTVEYLVYDRDSQNNECGLYVHYQSGKTADGAWDYSNGIIIDIYAYVYESGVVVSSGKTHWEDIGSENYQKVTEAN